MQKEAVESWVKNGPQPKLIGEAEKFGGEIQKKGLTTSQIRQVFTRLKSIEAKQYSAQRTEFMMLKPFVAYAAGRQGRVEGLQLFKERVTWGIDAVLDASGAEEEEKRFKNFCKLFEAILAYHKAHGGK
jgi:CRISPR-associated protein Csm2